MTPPSQKVTIAVTQSTSLKSVIAVGATHPDQINDLIARSRQRAKALSQTAGFVSMALHHSLDGRRVLEYSQWRSASSWQEAMQNLSLRVEGDLSGWDVHLYEIMLDFHRSGSTVLEIAEPSDVITMINVLSTDPSRQDQLLESGAREPSGIGSRCLVPWELHCTKA